MARKSSTLALNLREPIAGIPVYRWLYEELRAAILDGRLKPGVRLPATRDLADVYWLETSHTYTAEQVTKYVATFARNITLDEYPYLHEHAQQHMSEGPHREVHAFEFGLDLILDGLKRGL